MFARKFIVIASVLFVALSTPLYAKNAVLSELEIGDLTFMREEEKLARDVYAELYQYYKEDGTQLLILANIAASEQKHMDAMLNLLDKYGLDDPAARMQPGEFENTTLAALYQNLVSDSDANQPVLSEPTSGGKVSPVAALYAGAWIEERDMLDIMHAIENTSRVNIVGVYTELLCGSRSHLRAFVKQLGPDDYEPQILYSSDDAGSGAPPEETLEYWLGDESDEVCM
ncbi:MAG: DUF2202 domain-containing protein [Sedimenticolaceae bacterium]